MSDSVVKLGEWTKVRVIVEVPVQTGTISERDLVWIIARHLGGALLYNEIRRLRPNAKIGQARVKSFVKHLAAVTGKGS